MSTRKSSRPLIQGKLDFSTLKPKRTTIPNVKSKQQSKSTPFVKKVEIESSDESVDVDDIEVPSSSDDESVSDIETVQEEEDHKKMLQTPDKPTKQITQPKSILRQNVGAENQVAPDLNEKDLRYKAHYAVVREHLDHMKPIHSEGQGKIHEILRDFDMSYEYGPCVGVTRMQRWERAELLGLDPPQVVRDILNTKQGMERREFSQSVLFDEV